MEPMMLDRRQLVASLLTERKDLLVVSGLGSSTYDVAASGDHPLNFYLWGAMGGAAMVGLGLALAQPDRPVVVITGDGEALMGIGSLATIGVKQPHNLSIIVLDNAHYGETGMQPSHTKAGVDLVAIAKACRFPRAELVTDLKRAVEIRPLLHSPQGPNFIQAVVHAEEISRILPIRDGHEIKHRFMQALETRIEVVS
ncbi:MAG: aldehyde dehydrogenase [Bradyrhizobiaceae bacterium]|nr:aldehyde dehydrogenase [Bradyrhizobiaceae bacterium]